MRFRSLAAVIALLSVPVAAGAIRQSAARGFTVEQILGFPSPDNLAASPVGSAIAWTVNERGARSIVVAEGAAFEPRKVVTYGDDDGQELTQLAFSSDGKWIVYVRGAITGSGRGSEPPNPAQSPVAPVVRVLAVPVAGGSPKVIADADEPVTMPRANTIAFVRNRQIWFGWLDGPAPRQAFYARGTSESPAWRPEGSSPLAFVSNRGDHSFIGLFDENVCPTAGECRGGATVRFIAPTTSRDTMPVWSPDGKKIAFLRQPGAGGAPRPPLMRAEPAPWSIMVADATSKSDGPEASVALTSPAGGDPILQNPGGIGLKWAAGDRLVFASYRDGYPHLYALDRPGTGAAPRLLTPGRFMVEQWTLTPDRQFAIYSANTGSDRDDVDRRHLYKVPIAGGPPTPLTSGNGIEWGAVATADGQTIAFMQADARRPPAVAVMPSSGGTPRAIGANMLTPDFPADRLVTPELVAFRASDGVEAHGQLFKPAAGGARKAAIVYIHGGGPRQMLLGWHYRWEYANDYGANQYLVSRGFVVLSVDYRLSVGYGQAFQFPDNTGVRGATEYRDVLAAGKYLQSRPDVDPARIGVWGASLGGYLTALALGRNSEVFAAGVDIHGVHDRLALNQTQLAHAMVGDGLTDADVRQAMKVQFESSPIAAVPTWKSPVLLIHGDDDRTVDFHQTVNLEQRLLGKGVHVETLVLPDDVHDSLLWRHWTTAVNAMAEFFERTLKK